jgi:hypothetical protein
VEEVSPIKREVASDKVARAPRQRKTTAPKARWQVFRDHMVRYFGPKMEILEQCWGLIYVETKGCPGFCTDLKDRNLALYIALDLNKEHGERNWIQDVEEGDDDVQIIKPRSRWVVHSPGSKSIVMTNHCLGVCCEDLCRFLYMARRSKLSKTTLDRFTTMWKELNYGREIVIDLCDKRRKEKGSTITNARYLMTNMLVEDPRNLPVRAHNLMWITYHSLDEPEGFKPIST